MGLEKDPQFQVLEVIFWSTGSLIDQLFPRCLEVMSIELAVEVGGSSAIALV